MENVIELTDDNFQKEVIESEIPVLVDFWAPWCGPCRAVAPTIESMAADFAGKAKIAKLNVDDNQKVARELGIMSIPTVMAFNRKKVVDKRIGVLPRSEYDGMILAAMNNGAN